MICFFENYLNIRFVFPYVIIIFHLNYPFKPSVRYQIMFPSYYHLKSNPFKNSADPDFLWLGEKHKEGLATLRYGIQENKGFLLLTGDSGAGKTTLINALLNSLDHDVLVAVISDPGLSKGDFFNFIAHKFGSNRKFKSKGDFLIHFSKFLNNVYRADKKALLIIDEAQRLTSELLEEIRLLSNIEKQHTKLVNIFFAAQHEFNNLLHEDRNRALRQRMTLNYHISPLNADETALYISHRLEVAGTKEHLFDNDAVSEIFKFSGGSPRQINTICELALLTGYVNEKKIITADIIKECVIDLKIPHQSTATHKVITPTYRQNSIADTESEKDKPDKQINSNINLKNKIPEPLDSPLPEKGKTSSVLKVFLLLCLALTAGCALFFYMNKGNERNYKISEKTHYYYNIAKNFIAGEKQTENQINTPLSKEISGQSQENISVPAPEVPPEVENTNIEARSEKKSLKSTENNPIFPLIHNESSNHHVTLAEQASQVPSPPQAQEMMGATTTGTGIIHKIKIDKKLQEEISQETLQRSNGSNNTDTNIDFSYLKKTVTLHFSNNSNDLSTANLNEIDKICNILTNDNSKKIRISGHTDANGPPSYNLQLSKFRATIVKSYMLGRGVAPHQIEIEAKGGKEPIAGNNTLEGRLRNRRVELRFISLK